MPYRLLSIGVSASALTPIPCRGWPESALQRFTLAPRRSIGVSASALTPIPCRDRPESALEHVLRSRGGRPKRTLQRSPRSHAGTVERVTQAPYPRPRVDGMNTASRRPLRYTRPLLDLLGLLEGFVDRADHVERLFRQVVALAVDDHLEAADRFLQRHVLARRAREHFGDVERLRQETLDLTCARNRQLVFRRQLVHAQNRDDVAQFLVALQRLLNAAGDRVVLFADHVRVDLARRRVERVDGRIDTERCDVTRQNDGCVQVAEGGGRRRVGQVVRRHVHGLNRRDRAFLRRRDALLQLAHFFSQRRLIAHCRRHTAEQRRHFGTGQRETVDVVDEEQHVEAFVTEVLGHREARQRHAQTVARRLVHLAVHQRDLVENVRVLHFVVEVVPFTGTLAHAREHGVTAVLLRDVVDELHHVDGLAHARAAEQADLAALCERADQIDDLDARFEQFGRRRQLVERRRLLVDRALVFALDRSRFVDRAAEHVHDAAEGRLADRHRNRIARILHHDAAAQAVGGTQTDGTDHAVAQLLLDFERQFRAFQNERVVDLRHALAREFHVDNGADALYDLAFYQSSSTHRFSFQYLILYSRKGAVSRRSRRRACRVTPRRRRRRSPTIPS
ncbi:hypothetical protein BURPS1710b_0178 [Burkholderia pseudomallei 1710b]|uniref:Uncharacterized protein n=1 Tax=Burkholderia pseudomallei (strain 1710b) TaxID=320372 RepID=Q3JXV9_BURP1|nr:hypothetical protein BURPS1710b_0178 [Burkholderia pseudomallei 1710b]